MRLAEAQDSLINAQGVVVDELDRSKKGPQRKPSEDDIPDLELGEPEESVVDGGQLGNSDRIMRSRSLSNESHHSDKHVVVGANGTGEDGDELLTTEEAKEKHRQFEKQRRKHYEMRNIKELLAYVPCYFHANANSNWDHADHDRHHEEDEMDEDEDDSGAPPPMPRLPNILSK
jgi:protein phosphatase inhibitor 2